MYKLFKKLIAVMLVVVLAGANLSILGMYSISYALTDTQLANQTTTTQNSNVEFNSYFEGGVHVKTESIDSTTAKLYMNIQVKNAGYLKNGQISFSDVNFKINGEVESDFVQSVNKDTNTITLKQINNGSNVTLEIPISVLNNEIVKTDNFSRENTIRFTGKYIDGSGNEKDISKEIVNKLSWNGNPETVIESELTRFVPFATSGKYGVLLQVKVNTSVKDSILPIKSTQTTVQVPQINGVRPTSVNVIANNTKATNGEDDGLNFTSQNYNYDAENGTVKITTTNATDKIVWIKDVKDEYLVNFIYESEEIYNDAKTNGVNTSASVKATINVYNNEATQVESQEVSVPISRTEKLGTIADFDIYVDTQSVGKGQVYANYEATQKKETSYSLRYIATVNNAEITDTIKFTQAVDKFLTSDDTESLTTVSGENSTYNKKVLVNQKVFNKILGEDGTIDIYDENGTKIGTTINKEMTVDGNGNYSLDVSSANNNQLTIIASKPITEGQLVIEIEKAIKTDVNYTEAEFKTFKKMEMKLEGKASTSTVNASVQMLLKEPKSVAEVAISKTDLTTVVKNENVEIRATLDTSSINNALYKKPTLKIKLPSYISKVDLKDYDIVMDNGLTIKSATVATENGAQVINVVLEGTQTEYTIDAEYKGTIVVLNTDLTVNTLTPSNSNKITMEYTNENTASTNNIGTVETKLNFVAPTGLVAANGISNYADGKGEIFTISEESVTGTIAINAEKRTATVKGVVINNYENTLQDVVILGRIPVKDNTKIDTTDSLGSTFSTTLTTQIALTGIDASKYTIYYSNKANATKDVADANNGWTTEGTNQSKSYLIVTNGYDMAKGSKIEFSYDVEIPEKLKYNNSAYEMYKVYYNNVSDIGTIAETKVSSIVGITTGQGPELTAELASTVDTVREGQIVKMNVTVKNTGSVAANNVKINVPLPEYAKFMYYYTDSTFIEENITSKEFTASKIDANGTYKCSYYIQIDKNIAESLPQEVVNKINVTSNELTENISSNEYKFNIQKGSIELKLVGSKEDTTVLNKLDTVRYILYLNNISESDAINNMVVTIPLPQGVELKAVSMGDDILSSQDVTDGIEYDKESNIAKINVGTLNDNKVIIFKVEIQECTGNVKMIATAEAEGIEKHYSNAIEYNTEKVKLEISELTSTPKYVKELNNVTYKLTIKNIGNVVANNIEIIDQLPSELQFEEITYTKGDSYTETITSNADNNVKIIADGLGSGESINVTIIAKANLLSDKNDKEIQNHITVSAQGFDEVNTNTVTNIIEYDANAHETPTDPEDPIDPIDPIDPDDPTKPTDPTDPEDPNNPTDPTDPSKPAENRYKITGTAWIDSNKDGKRDSSEDILPNVTVILLNKENNSIVKDPDSNEDKRVTTGSDGKYEFTNLPQGEYIVVFLYDTSKYTLTTYRAKGVDEYSNSDAISINITVDGNRTIAGITDAIKITNENVRDMDIGVYTSEKFDLSLEKYVSKIVLTTPTIGTRTDDHDNSKTAKVEVLGSNVGKSNIVVEYKIVVKNEGEVAGYAKKIVDYLPEGVGFNTELNKDWYLSDNGNVYNASLANEIINPGETKEIKLILTKKITEESLGILSNNAEIYETYNEQGLKDIDSTAGNKAENEDDMSKADIAISIVTGKIIMYTTITFGVIAILGFGVYEIKKRVLNKKNK